MAPPFTRKYRDHSNYTGFQFEFFCDKCGKGHRSRFRTSGVGMAATMLRVAAGLLGGRVSRASWGASHLTDALRGPAWVRAFARAVEEMRPGFRQCTRCSKWVCPDLCWDQAHGLCQACAPDPGVAACLHCQARLVSGARFCAACGKPVGAVGAGQDSLCTACGASMPAGARFCPGCGAAVAPPG